MTTLKSESTTDLIRKAITRYGLWWLVNSIGLLLAMRLAWMLYDAPRQSGPLLFESGLPLDIIAYSGKTGLVLLVLSLACTPLARIAKVTQAIGVRKSLGLWGAFFAAIHSLYFLGGKELLYRTQAWPDVWELLIHAFAPNVLWKARYSQVGIIAIALLIPLVLTSNQWAMRRLGKNWKRLHTLVYLIVPLVAWHFWWQSNMQDKFFNWEKVIFAVIIAGLLFVRIPRIRRALR